MERVAFRISGFVPIGVFLVLAAIGLAVVVPASGEPGFGARILWVGIGYGVLALLAATGFVVVSPNEAKVVQFFGRYTGSIREPGLHWTWPLTERKRVTLRVRNFETARLKVSDADGNPVEIAAVVVSEELTQELRERVELAGVEVLESRITHLAYAPEIAHAMLARQQASAVVAARFKIVEGAVGMVSNALDRLREDDVVELDEERKAQMVSNLLVVLCGDRAAQPVVNTGSLYN